MTFLILSVLSLMNKEKIFSTLNSCGTITINKVKVYKNGKFTGRYKFQEILTFNSVKQEPLLEFSFFFPKKIYKTKTNYKLTYVGLSAVKVLKEALPFLKNEKKISAAKIILKLHEHKNCSKQHAPNERYVFRNNLREQLLNYLNDSGQFVNDA